MRRPTAFQSIESFLLCGFLLDMHSYMTIIFLLESEHWYGTVLCFQVELIKRKAAEM